MRKLKLPYNKTEDPFVAAERFLSANDIPSWYLDQVANFIMENAEVHYVSPGIHDPFTGGARYVPGTTSNVGNDGLNDPFTGGSRYNPGGTSSTNQPINVSFASKSSNAVSSNPHYPITSYQTFTSPVDYVTKIMGKFKEFCQTYPDECVASDEDISAIEAMCISLVNSKPPNQHHIPLLLKLLDWPPQYIFPVLDIIRLAILDPSCAQMLFDLTDYSQRLFQLSCHPDADSKNQLLVLKILVNSFVHGETWFQSQLLVIFDIVGKLSDIQLSKSHQIALSVLFINLSCYYCKFGIDKITEMIKFHIRVTYSYSI
jgi:phospholipase A-2-activating protein